MVSPIKKIKDEILEIENLIPNSYQNLIISRIDGVNHFPWFTLHKIGHPDFFSKGQNSQYKDPYITDDIGLFHMAFDGTMYSPHYDFFYPILSFFEEKSSISVKKLLRIRLRYTHPSLHHTPNKYAPPHVDFPTSHPYYTLIYYVDDADGDTIIFDKLYNQNENYSPVLENALPILHRIKPKKGKAVFFNGHRYHSGNYPIETSSRIVINFDFEIND